MEARTTVVEPGTSLGRFQLGDAIGSGAMGTVYRAVDPTLGRTVAIKVLHDEQARPRLLREAQAMARLSHPNVVPVHEIGTSEQLFIVMELVSGGTVRQWLAEPRTPAEILGVFEQAGRGLAAAHAAGLVHRDFKPENILRGDDGRVRVVDFGLVASQGHEREEPIVTDGSPLDLALTHTGLRLGTPAYMAPEQHRGESTGARSDQFSFAVACYEALYGERPFAGDTYRVMVRNVYAGTVSPPPAGRAVPAHVRAALLRALAVDPAARFPSMDLLLDALAAPAAAVAVPEPVAAPRRRSRAVVAGVVSAVAIATGLLAFALVPRGESSSSTPVTSPTPGPASAPDPRPAPPRTVEVPVPAPAPASATVPPQAMPAEPARKEPRDSRARKSRVDSPAPSPATTPSSPPAVDEAAARRRKQLELSE